MSNSNVVTEDLSAHFVVPEQAPYMTYVGDVVHDAQLYDIYDEETLSRFEYSFLSQGDYQDLFQLDPKKGVLRAANPIDRDSRCPGQATCYIMLSVAIVKPVEYFQVISVKIDIADKNDNSPVFTPSAFKVRFSESDPIGTRRSLPIALDMDSPRYGVRSYRMVTFVDAFELKEVVNQENGLNDLQLIQRVALDRETVGSYQVLIEALDGGTPPRNGTLHVDIEIEDDNDHHPVFRNSSFTVHVGEDFPLNATIFKAKARDPDLGDNGRVQYSFAPRTATLYNQLFRIHPRTGEISLKKHLDFETMEEYHLEILASDSGPNSQSSQANLLVRVLDVNDNIPHITVTVSSQTGVKEAKVRENLPGGQFTAHILVNDADRGKNGEVECRMTDINFHLEMLKMNQYKVTTAVELDRESKSRYSLEVYCWDHGQPRLASSYNLTVLVEDTNDHSPTFGVSEYVAAVKENNMEGAVLLHVSATDRDSGLNGELLYTILEPDMSRFVYVDLDHSGIIRARTSLNYEEKHQLQFTITATDKGEPARSTTATATINILDINDNAPVFLDQGYKFQIEENQPKDAPVGYVSATDADDAPFNYFEYSLSPSRESQDSVLALSINTFTGEIYTLRSLDRETHGIYYLTVYATDVDNPNYVSSSHVAVEVMDQNDNDPVFVNPSKSNVSFHISNRVPVGYNITRILATDADVKDNGKLVYKIVNSDALQTEDGEHSELFMMEKDTGMLSTSYDFNQIALNHFKLEITAEDCGTPARSATVDVLIVVDKEVQYLSPQELAQVRRQNKLIIVSVASVSVIVIGLLIMAIVILKTMDKRHRRKTTVPDDQQGEKQPLTDLSRKATPPVANGKVAMGSSHHAAAVKKSSLDASWKATCQGKSNRKKVNI